MHKHVTLDLPYSPICPCQVYANILRLHASTPNNISLPSKLLISRSHSLMCLLTQPIYVTQLVSLSVQLVYPICQPVTSSPLLVIVFENTLDFRFNSEKFMAERIVGLTAIHQFLLVVTFLIWLKHTPLHFEVTKLLV